MKPEELPEPARRLRRRILYHLKRARKHSETIEDAIYIADLESRVESDVEFFMRKWEAGAIPVLMIRVKRAERGL
jgi:hypothetical protein